MSDFSPEDHWKALVLYGLNTATYKIALGKTLLKLCSQGKTTVPWETLSKEFFDIYNDRLGVESPMPQLDQPGRQTVMENLVARYQTGSIDYDTAIGLVGKKAFGDVIPRFQRLGKTDFAGKFYTFDEGKALYLTDDLHSISEELDEELHEELDARWGLLEGAFEIGQSNFQLNNDLRRIYIAAGYERKDLTSNIPFLQGYQGNTCFYCGEPIAGDDIEVDHVLPRQVLKHDEIWNLVLSHSFCNNHKTDRLVGPHFVQKLIARNENIMGSNHPWKKKIEASLGNTKARRKKTTLAHYDNVSQILGWNYWGGADSFSPETDPFFRRMITVINNG